MEAEEGDHHTTRGTVLPVLGASSLGAEQYCHDDASNNWPIQAVMQWAEPVMLLSSYICQEFPGVRVFVVPHISSSSWDGAWLQL